MMRGAGYAVFKQFNVTDPLDLRTSLHRETYMPRCDHIDLAGSVRWSQSNEHATMIGKHCIRIESAFGVDYRKSPAMFSPISKARFRFWSVPEITFLDIERPKSLESRINLLSTRRASSDRHGPDGE